MKRFAFRLQVVLDQALKQEEALLLALAALQQERLRGEQAVAATRAQRETLLGGTADRLHATFAAHEIQDAYLRLDDLNNRLAQQEATVREVDTRIATKQAEVVEAMRRRQLLEKLREKRQDAYRREFERWELQTMEETVLPRLARDQSARGV